MPVANSRVFSGLGHTHEEVEQFRGSRMVSFTSRCKMLEAVASLGCSLCSRTRCEATTTLALPAILKVFLG